MIPRLHWSFLAIQWSLAVVLFSHTQIVAAQGGVCAEVRIEILQTVSLERQAFDATLRIRNGLTTVSIENINVDLDFRDIDDIPVIGTTDPNATDATFFYREDGLINISDTTGTGLVAPETVAEARWLIIPAPGSGGTEGFGKQYFIGATITYAIGGEEQTIDVIPEVITVKPQPILELDYFLQEKVYADDPFTPEVEPSEPFTLGVMVQNVGGGFANNMSIDSAQPRIIENELGLLIGFQIDSSFVDDSPAEPTLLIDFGDIEPGATHMGRWLMSTTLAGEFTEFDSSFTHSDGLGGEL
ncbi:calcium-binding protein, partial [Pseudomonadota bacterium]